MASLIFGLIRVKRAVIGSGNFSRRGPHHCDVRVRWPARLLTSTLLGAAGVTVLSGTVLSGPAWAHVTVDPGSAPKGGEVTLGFRVPNEESNASTVELQVVFPSDHPILGVDPEPTPGWTDKITTTALHPPVTTDDGPVTSYVSEIDWTGGSIPPGDFQEFHVLAQQLPTDTDTLTFKALQTYSDGNVVRWIQTTAPGQPDPEHPAPTLTLTAASGATTNSGSSSSNTTAIIGIVLGAVGTVAGVGALVVVMRRRPTPAGS